VWRRLLRGCCKLCFLSKRELINECIILLILFFSFVGFNVCAEKTVYANSSQTNGVKRFDTFTRIDGCPTYPD
jgi:hypothetical protein